jgi:hypothetical protein
MEKKPIKMAIESLTPEELKQKLEIKRRKANERQRKFRADQKAKNPDYLKEKAEYQKELRIKEKEIYGIISKVEQVKINIQNDIQTQGAKETKKPTALADTEITEEPVAKETKKLIVDTEITEEPDIPKVPDVPENTINPELYVKYDNGMILLDMTYFKDINYNIIKNPYWQKATYNTEEELIEAKALSETRIKTHITKLSVIYNEYFDIPFDPKIKDYTVKILQGHRLSKAELKYIKTNDDFFADTDNFLKHIKYFAKQFIVNPRKKGCNDAKPSLNTFNDYLKHLTNILSRVEYDEDVKNNYNILSNIVSHFENIYKCFKKHNIITTDENGNDKTIDYGNYEKTKELMDTNETLTVEEKALAACYLLFPTRRVEEYQHLKLSKDINKTKDLKHNYLVVDEDNNIKSFVFNKYKTYKTYKSQTYNLDEYNDLKTYLNPHILTVNENDYIFKTAKTNKMYDQSNFSSKLKKIFTSIFKISLTLDNVRSASETYNNNTPGRTLHQREQFSLMMGHALSTGMGYTAM